MRRQGPADGLPRRRAIRETRGQRQRPGGDAEIIVIARPVEGAEILEMQPEEPPAQRAPALGAQRAGEGGRHHQGPALILGGDTRHRHRVAQSKGAAVARRRHVEPCQLLACREIGQIGAQSAGFGQERHHRHHLPQRHETQGRAARGFAPGADQVRQHRNRQMRARGMAHHEHLVHILAQGRGDVILEQRQPCLERRRVGSPPPRGKSVVVHQVVGEDAAVMAFAPQQHGAGHTRQHRPVGHPARQARPAPERRREAARERPQSQPQPKLHQQHHHRVERRDHRPFAQPHQPHQSAARHVGPGGA